MYHKVGLLNVKGKWLGGWCMFLGIERVLADDVRVEISIIGLKVDAAVEGNGILMTVGENGRIVNTELHKEANKAYMSYAMSVYSPAIMATDNFKTIWMLELGTLDGVLTTRPPWRWLDDQFGLLDYKTAQLVKEALNSEWAAIFTDLLRHLHVFPCILVNVRKSGDDDALGVIREVLLFGIVRICYITRVTPIHDGMRMHMRERAWNPYTPMSPPRDSWEDGNPGSWGSSPQYQPGSPHSRAYEAHGPILLVGVTVKLAHRGTTPLPM
ncbi:hypothetical protein Tco_1356679, partial [Tanacetum coccineum]